MIKIKVRAEDASGFGETFHFVVADRNLIKLTETPICLATKRQWKDVAEAIGRGFGYVTAVDGWDGSRVYFLEQEERHD